MKNTICDKCIYDGVGDEKVNMFEKKETFEDYLQKKFWEDEPQTLDDQFPDAFNDWLENIDTQEVVDYAEKWGNKLRKLIKERNK